MNIYKLYGGHKNQKNMVFRKPKERESLKMGAITRKSRKTGGR